MNEFIKITWDDGSTKYIFSKPVKISNIRAFIDYNHLLLIKWYLQLKLYEFLGIKLDTRITEANLSDIDKFNSLKTNYFKIDAYYESFPSLNHNQIWKFKNKKNQDRYVKKFSSSILFDKEIKTHKKLKTLNLMFFNLSKIRKYQEKSILISKLSSKNKPIKKELIIRGLNELKIKTLRIEKFKNIELFNNTLLASYEELILFDKKFNFNLNNYLNCIRNKFKNIEIDTSLSLGDFTPWNSSFSISNKINIFDFEFSSQIKPVNYDLIHYLLQPKILFIKKINNNKLITLFDNLNKLFKVNNLDFYKDMELYLYFFIKERVKNYINQSYLQADVYKQITIWSNILEILSKNKYNEV